MSMVTSCPACTTTFRVTPEQLKQRQGKVRCGRCRGVFDAFKSLATMADDAAAEPEERASAATAAPSAPAAATAPMQATLDIGPAAPGRIVPDSFSPPARSRLPQRLLIFGLLPLCVLAAGAQLAYTYRDRLAAAWPSTRPLLERMCAAVGCAVAWPRRPDLLAIEASDLQADPARPNVIVLTATLRNRGEVAVARPAIEVTFTDVRDQMLARRVLLPAEYMARGLDASSPMQPLAEVDVRLALDTGDLRPAGYRLFLLYP